MGRYYNVTEGNLYIFTTNRDMLLDLGVFPKELNMFEAESSWRISPWIAVVENILYRVAENAQIVLQLNGYEHSDAPFEALEAYFLDGDEFRLMRTIVEQRRKVTPVALPLVEESN